MSQRKTPRAGTPAFRQYVMEQLQQRMLVDAPLQLASDGLDLNDPTVGGLDPTLFADPAPSQGADSSSDDGFTPLDSASFGSYSTPTLNVRSTANGTEAGPVDGRFRFSLTYGLYGGPYTATSDIAVSYSVSGTATQYIDYGVYNSTTHTWSKHLPGSVVIPAGSSFVDEPYTPVNDTLVEPDETVIVTAQASPSFTLGLNPATSLLSSDDYTIAVVSPAATPINISVTNAGGPAGPKNQDIVVQVKDGNNKGVNLVQIEAHVSSETGCDVDITAPAPGTDGVADAQTDGTGANAGKATFTVSAVSGSGTAKVTFVMRLDSGNKQVVANIKVN